MHVGTMTFTERGRLKKRLNNRLRADGFWNAYNELRAHLKASGVAESEAWRVAAYKFPPKDGSVAEIVADQQYPEIAANWANGNYSTPDSADDSGAARNATATASGPPDPNGWKADYEKLAAEVGPRTAPEIDEVRWVLANYLADVKRIRPEDVPSAASLSILMWVQMSPAHFGDFLRTHNCKLLPDKKALEHEARFVDDGRCLQLIEEFEASLAAEEKAEFRDKYLALDPVKRESFKRVVETLQETNALLPQSTSIQAGIDHCHFPVSGLSEQLADWDRQAATTQTPSPQTAST